MLDGVNQLPDVVERAAAMGQSAIAITDHGNMHGALQFYQACKSSKIKPIIGCEFYINPVSRHERKSRAQGGAANHHLTVLAKNQAGYTNLCRLVSAAYKEGFYFKPRIDHELLEEYKEGLVVLSGCLGSEVGGLIQDEQVTELKSRIDWYAKTLKEDYYLEVQPHPIEEQIKHNAVLADHAKDLGIAMVATTDCHYPTPDFHHAQEVLMCISTAKQITDPDRLKHDGVGLHLKSADEMYKEFGQIPYVDEAIKNTIAIAEKCELDFEFGKFFMPKFEVPKETTLDDELRASAEKGLEQRIQHLKDIGEWKPNQLDVYKQRLEQELEILISMGFAGYFLVVADFINWSKNQGIPVGPGRGSAAGSLVAYCMRITEVDPIMHKLLFERFLNPERLSMPCLLYTSDAADE